MIVTILMLSLFIIKVNSVEVYNFSNFTSGKTYISNKTLINSTKYVQKGACTTMEDLVAYHMTDTVSNQVPSEHVFPENFCYGLLEYNITKDDFFNIISKNINAFKNYRKLIPFYIFYNFTPEYTVMDDGCIGYLRLMACYNEFPACEDNLDKEGTFKVNGICKNKCSKFKIRCGDFYFDEFCKRQSKRGYCAGKGSDKAWYLEINYKLFIFLIAIIATLV